MSHFFLVIYKYLIKVKYRKVKTLHSQNKCQGEDLKLQQLNTSSWTTSHSRLAQVIDRVYPDVQIKAIFRSLFKL